MGLMAVAARKRFTYGDFLRFPDDGNRHEVIEGEWIMTPPPTTDHQKVVSNLHLLRAPRAGKKDGGELLFSPVGVVLTRTDAVQPDLLFLSSRRAGLLRKDAIHGAPDLIVEVLSPSTASLDRGKKLRLYGRAGVREYWIVDPASRTVEVHEFGRARRTRIHPAGQSFGSSVLPGLRLEVDAVFARLR